MTSEACCQNFILHLLMSLLDDTADYKILEKQKFPIMLKWAQCTQCQEKRWCNTDQAKLKVYITLGQRVQSCKKGKSI